MADEPVLRREHELAAARATVAVLYKNGKRFEIAPSGENRQWSLLGTGVLVRGRKVLTTGHVIGHARYRRFEAKRAKIAVFIPGSGIFRVVNVSSEGGRPSRLDYMHVLLLQRRVRNVPMVPPDLIDKRHLAGKDVQISSFGLWEDTKTIKSGLIRSETVRLRSKRPDHNLDLQWSRSQGPTPGPGSSGGAVVYPADDPERARVVGLVREVTEDDVIGSWVSTERWNKKDRLEQLRIERPIRRNAVKRPLVTLVHPGGATKAWTIPLERIARELVVTINATRPIQCAVLAGGNQENAALARLGTRPPGRFIVRKISGPSGAFDAITVAVAGVDAEWNVRAEVRWS